MRNKRSRGFTGPGWKRRACQAAGAATLLTGLAGAPPAFAGIFVGANETNGSYQGATTDMDCESVEVAGTLDLSNSTLTKIGSVIVHPGGTLIGTNANLEVSGVWQDDGTFTATDGTVTVTNVCNTTTTFSGNTTFNNLSATGPASTLNFAAGSEQKVGGALTLKDVTLLGPNGVAYLTLLPKGTQDIDKVGVDKVNATRGQHLAPTKDNVIPNGSAPNWFRTPSGPLTPVPTTSPGGLALMGLLIGLAAFARRKFAGKWL